MLVDGLIKLAAKQLAKQFKNRKQIHNRVINMEMI